MNSPAQPQHDILLESGTNKLEILVFTLRKQRFGVNVAKVRKVIDPPTVTGLPESHEAVNGVFTLRDAVTPLIDLGVALRLKPDAESTSGRIILMEFNDVRIGFLVETVERIHRVSWKEVCAMPDLAGVRSAPVTSVVFLDGNLVQLLDFEKLVFDIGGVDLLAEQTARISADQGRAMHRLLLAEDSHLMRRLIHETLVKGGYTDVTACADGQAAWEQLEQNVAREGSPGFALLVTDIEMPRIDGLHLTRRIKDHPQMKDLPVILFSSLVSADNDKKCRAVGADAQITKPQLDQLVELIDRLVVGAPQATLV